MGKIIKVLMGVIIFFTMLFFIATKWENEESIYNINTNQFDSKSAPSEVLDKIERKEQGVYYFG